MDQPVHKQQVLSLSAQIVFCPTVEVPHRGDAYPATSLNRGGAARRES